MGSVGWGVGWGGWDGEGETGPVTTRQKAEQVSGTAVLFQVMHKFYKLKEATRCSMAGQNSDSC